MNDKLDFRVEAQEEKTKIKEAQLDAEKAQLVLDREAKIAEIREGAPKTLPIIDSKIGVHLRHGFVMGEPEIDVEQMKDMVDMQKQLHEKQMEVYHEDLKSWFNDKLAYDKETRAQAVLLSKSYGELSCQVVPKNIPFSQPPPVRPKNTIAMNEIPLVMSVRMVAEVRDSFIEKSIPGRMPEKIPCEFIDKGLPCDNGVPCAILPAVPPMQEISNNIDFESYLR